MSNRNVDTCDMCSWLRRIWSIQVCVMQHENVDYVSLTSCLHVCLWTIFNLTKQLHCFSLFLYFTGRSLLMAVMENATWPHPSYLPHYLLRGDPFASRLSREADVVAALYVCIIGESFVKKNHRVCINVWFSTILLYVLLLLDEKTDSSLL